MEVIVPILIALIVLFVITLFIILSKKNKSDAAASTLTKPVIIIGGGLTGLITAYELTKANIPFIILEKNSHVGGRILTVRYPDGETSEAPLEEYWARSPAVALLRELNVPLLESEAHASVCIDKKIHICVNDGNREDYLAEIFESDIERAAFMKFNNKMWSLYKELDNCHPFSIAHTADIIIPENLKQLMKISFGDFVRRHGLPRNVEEWIRITLEPEIATEWDTISALDVIDELRIVWESPVDPTGQDINAGHFGEHNYHIPTGNSTFIKALVQKLPPNTIHLNCAVTQIISLTGEGVVVKCIESESRTGNDKIDNHIGSYAVVTIPIFDLKHIRFYPPLDQDRINAMRTTNFGSYIKIHLRLKPEAQKIFDQVLKTNCSTKNVATGKAELFTLLTDDITVCIYDSAHGGEDAKCVCDTSSADTIVGTRCKCKDLSITLLLHGKYAKSVCNHSDAELESLVLSKLDLLFPTVSRYVNDVEIFCFDKAIAYWPVHLGRSRFDDLSIKLRQPFNKNILIGGDMTCGSHSEGAAVSAKNMSKFLISQISSSRKEKPN